MRFLKLFTLAIACTTMIWSCQTGPSETDNAYAEVVSHTDSIQKMNMNLKDTLSMVMSANQKLMSSMDTVKEDSTNMATLSRNQVIFDEQNASLNKIDEVVSDFEAFEADHDKGDMNEKDVKAKIDEIKKQQNDIFKQQKDIKKELDRIHDDQRNMMDRKRDAMTDGEKVDNKTNANQTKTGKK